MAVWQQLRWSPMKALGRYGSHLLESTGPDRSPRSRIATPVVAGESGENSSTAAVERSTDVVQRTPAADQRGRGVRCCQRIAPSIRVRGSIVCLQDDATLVAPQRPRCLAVAGRG